MNIAVVGTGYVGLVSGTCFAETGNRVICVDIDEKKVARMKKGEIPIYEPGLDLIFDRNTRQGRLQFTTELAEAVEQSDVIFLALPTPPGADGSADLRFILGVADDLSKIIKSYKVIVDNSTVPVGTAEKVHAFLAKNLDEDLFDVVSNAEFRREGVAVGDVQDAGSFGDFMGGPTEINRDSDSAANELLNRLKFGIEGAAFTGAFGAAGKLVGKMREVRGSNKVKRGFDKSVDKLDSWFRSNGLLTQEGCDVRNVMRGRIARDTNVGDVAMRQIDKLTDKLARNYRNVAVDKVPFLEAKKTIGKELNDVLMSSTAKNGRLLNEKSFTMVDEIALDATGKEFKTGKQLYNVELLPMNQTKKETLRKALKNKYKANDKQITELFDEFDTIRGTWGELFTIMGRRLITESLKSFETMIPKYINDVLDRGYEYVKAPGSNSKQLANNNRH